MSNLQTVPELSSYCSRTKGKQKGLDSGMEGQKKENVPDCSPLSSYKDYKKVDISWGNDSISKTNSTKSQEIVYKTIRKNEGTQEQEGTNFQPPKPVDSRFKDPLFRASVRTVLEHLGLKSNMGNFRKYDSKHGGIIHDWLAFAERISSPRMTAEVAVKGARGEMLFCVDLPGRSRQEAIKKLDTERFVFKRWI